MATSTCDPVPAPREGARLLPIEPLGLNDYESQQKLQSVLSNFVTFQSTRYFYVLGLPNDEPDVRFNVAHLDPLSRCATGVRAVAERRPSMTLIGWRVFGAGLCSVQARQAEGEAELRTAGNEHVKRLVTE